MNQPALIASEKEKPSIVLLSIFFYILMLAPLIIFNIILPLLPPES